MFNNSFSIMITRLILYFTFGCLMLVNPAYAQTAEEYVNKGFARVDAGDDKGAMEDFTKAIGINPRYAKAYYIRGILKGKLGDPKGALADINKAIELNPQDADAYSYNSRGTAKKELGDYGGAIEDTNKAIELNPNL